MKRIIFLIALPFICFSTSNSQSNDLDFMINKIKVDYPGFVEKTKYINFDSLVSEVITDNIPDTFRAMAKIIDFFKDGHLDIILKSPADNRNELPNNLNRIIQHFRKNVSKATYEGYWINDYNNCVIAIIQENRRPPLSYKAYVVETRDTNSLPLGTLLAEFETIRNNKAYTKYRSPQTGNALYIYSEFRSKNIITTGSDSKWTRLKSYVDPILSKYQPFDSNATLAILNSNTILFRLPLSTRRNNEIIDSLTKAFDGTLRKTSHLIIDLRNNMGGGVGAFFSFAPYLYTNPIKLVSGATYSTEDLIADNQKEIQEHLLSGNIDSSFLIKKLNTINYLKEHLGELIPRKPHLFTLDSTLSYPKKVSIIINYACQSAAEMMLLNMQQSQKVTLFGEHTQGVVDYLNYYPIPLPSSKYSLLMPTAKRIIEPHEKKLDGVGIYPDVPINDQKTDWIKFVIKYYETH